MKDVMAGMTLEGTVIFSEPSEKYRQEGMPDFYEASVTLEGGGIHKVTTTDKLEVGQKLRLCYVGNHIVRIERLP